MAGADRPNIILIETDSMDGRMMGCMGFHPALAGVTPNLDGLATRGALFRTAYSNNPICCPSRSSMWSGLYTHHCEGWNNYKGLEEGTPTFLDRLNAVGYRSNVVGKTDYLSGNHTIRARVSPWTRSAMIPGPHYRMGPPRVQHTRERRVHERDWADTDAAVAWLRQNAAADEPLFLYLGIRSPHPTFVTSDYYLDRIDAALVDVPERDHYTHPVLEYQRQNKNWEHGFNADTVRLIRRIYFAMIAEVDEMVGEVLTALSETGLGDTTHVIFTSDHGEMAMEHRQFYKTSHYEPSAHIPMIVAGPGIPAGGEAEAPVSLVDIYPTLMEIAGAEGPQDLDGHSLLTLAREGADLTRPDWAFSECHDSSCGTGFFMLRRGPWKYMALPGFAPLLFNLDDDPGEVHDLAPSRPEVVGEMDAALRGVVDYEAVDTKVKAYDRAAFSQWRKDRLAEGTYRELMARVHSGWDGLKEGEGDPWTDDDEERIVTWLESR